MQMHAGKSTALWAAGPRRTSHTSSLRAWRGGVGLGLASGLAAWASTGFSCDWHGLGCLVIVWLGLAAWVSPRAQGCSGAPQAKIDLVDQQVRWGIYVCAHLDLVLYGAEIEKNNRHLDPQFSVSS